MDHFWFIRDHALKLWFETGVDDVDELEYRSFVWEEVGLIRQFTKMMLQMSGGRPGWVPDRIQNETDLSAIGMAIWDSATAILMKHEKNDEEKDENYCVKHCNAIIAATWRIEELLLAHAWRAGVTSPQKTWIKCFREIRELALKCECQIQRQNALEEVWQQMESIEEKAQRILDNCGASLREQVDEDEDSDVSDIFGVILDVTADILVGASNDCVSACSQIIHASHKIEELLSLLLPERKKEKREKDKRPQVTEIIVAENPSHSSVSSPSSPSSPSNHVPQEESSISPERVVSESHGEMKSLQDTGNQFVFLFFGIFWYGLVVLVCLKYLNFPFELKSKVFGGSFWVKSRHHTLTDFLFGWVKENTTQHNTWTSNTYRIGVF